MQQTIEATGWTPDLAMMPIGQFTERLTEGSQSPLLLNLNIVDPEVAAALRIQPEGEPRNQFALEALRLGVLALRAATGQIDTGAVRAAGEKLISDMGSLLEQRAEEVNRDMAESFRQYFDPETGLLPQRLQSLVQNDGDLERLLKTHLAPQDSTIARALTEHLGAGSPIFKMLSPTEAGGLRLQVADVLEQALTEQRRHILREFSLDTPDSALSRMIGKLTSNNGQLTSDLHDQLGDMVKEFSLDQPDSALSRLVSKVEAAQSAIVEQFSVDNEQSGMTRITKMLQSTSDQIDKNLTLDDENSALFRLKRELKGMLDDIGSANNAFQIEVRSTLEGMQARKKEAARSTQHGHTFEAELAEVLALEAQHLGDRYDATGSSCGLIKSCKIGDYVIELGVDSAAPGVKVVWEAKEDQSYDLKAALTEVDQARKNRGAQIGVFVFSATSAPKGITPFGRHGNDLIVVWDAEDAATDIYVKAAYSVARALAIREKKEQSETTESIVGIEQATRAIEKQIQYLDEFKTMGTTVKNHGEKIADRAERMKKQLLKDVETLDHEVSALKAEAA